MTALNTPTVRSAGRALALACCTLAFTLDAPAQGHRGGGGGHAAHVGAGNHHGGYRGGYGGGSRGVYHGGYRGGSRWGGGHHGYRGGWPVWGGIGLGIGLGLGSYYYGAPYYVNSPDYVVVDPPVLYTSPQPVPAADPRPVIYPRNGQSAARIDADSNACSEWAGQQPNATVEASVFRRAISACMDARGYTVR